jgi:hypothetical protein
MQKTPNCRRQVVEQIAQLPRHVITSQIEYGLALSHAAERHAMS